MLESHFCRKLLNFDGSCPVSELPSVHLWTKLGFFGLRWTPWLWGLIFGVNFVYWLTGLGDTVDFPTAVQDFKWTPGGRQNLGPNRTPWRRRISEFWHILDRGGSYKWYEGKRRCSSKFGQFPPGLTPVCADLKHHHKVHAYSRHEKSSCQTSDKGINFANFAAKKAEV